jgi:uncharacterized Zn finger protein
MSDVSPGREFRRLFSRRSVQALAGARSFERGQLYAASGRVGRRVGTDGSVTAKLRGASSYTVKLWVEGGAQYSECSCPVGVDGRFCKHAVAVALVATEAVSDTEASKDFSIDLRDYLTSLDHSCLVDLVLERADADDLFDARLRLQATGATDGPLPVAAFREAVDRVFFTDGYVHYRDMYAYTSKGGYPFHCPWGATPLPLVVNGRRRHNGWGSGTASWCLGAVKWIPPTSNIHEMLTTLRDLLEDGHAEEVIDLAEQAIDRAEDALDYVDDSDGYMSGIADDLQGLHLDACLSARPDPVALATTLFERELHSGDPDVFHGAAASYAEVLGKPGLAEYRRRAQITWDALPALGPGDKGSFDSCRFQITSMMRTLAEVAGDVDAVVEVLARDQSSPYRFVLIAERLRDADRYDDALAWAQKGLELFACEDSRLVDAATREYHRAGRGADAVALAWRAYDERTTPAGYQRLCEQARLAGVWEGSRQRALAKLRAQVETEIAAASRKKTGRSQPWAVCDASALVSVFLFEGDVDQAWSEAQTAGCSRALWLELARLREQGHPSEAIPIWQSDVELAIDAKNNHAYAEAVATIAKVRRLVVAAGHEESFRPYTAQLRARHKAKRNLMRLFDQRGW